MKYTLTAEEFKILRLALSLSRKWVAERCGVKPRTVGKWERGESGVPNYAVTIMLGFARDK